MIPSHKSIHFDSENTTFLVKVSFEQNCQSQEECRREEEQEPSKLMGHLDQHVKWQSSFKLETQCNHSLWETDKFFTASFIWLTLLLPQKYIKKKHLYLIEKECYEHWTAT